MYWKSVKWREADLVGAEDNDKLNKILNSNINMAKCSVTVPENLEDIGCFIHLMKNNEDLKNIINKIIEEKKESGELEKWLYDSFAGVFSVYSSSFNEDSKPGESTTEINKN